MANFCFTGITFFTDSNNRPVLDKMFNDFCTIRDLDEEDKDSCSMLKFAKHYFPYIADHIDCRGIVDGFSEQPSDTMDKKYRYFSMFTETVWDAKMGLWYHIVTQFYPGVQIAYSAEECGNGYFLVYDNSEGQRFYHESFYVDGYFPNDDDENSLSYIDDDIKYFGGTLDELQEHLDNILPFKYEHQDTVEELDKELNTKLLDYTEALGFDDDAYIFVSEFVEYPPSEFDLLDF